MTNYEYTYQLSIEIQYIKQKKKGTITGLDIFMIIF